MELRYNNTMNLNLDTTQFTKVSDIVVPDIFYRRMKTGVDEIDLCFYCRCGPAGGAVIGRC